MLVDFCNSDLPQLKEKCCISGLVLIDARVFLDYEFLLIAVVVLFDWFDLFLCI